jgi:hypothetical protein
MQVLLPIEDTHVSVDFCLAFGRVDLGCSQVRDLVENGAVVVT